jgi:S-adenosylmethionine:tRNA-ribosyltransferase-isomerase (queuine synthetase)
VLSQLAYTITEGFLFITQYYLDMVVGFTTNCAINAKSVSSNHVHDEEYSIQQYVITFISDLGQVGGFHWLIGFPSPIELTATT